MITAICLQGEMALNKATRLFDFQDGSREAHQVLLALSLILRCRVDFSCASPLNIMSLLWHLMNTNDEISYGLLPRKRITRIHCSAVGRRTDYLR